MHAMTRGNTASMRDADGGLVLWAALKEALSQDEEKLKWCICFLDMCVRNGERFTGPLRKMMNTGHDTEAFEVEEGCEFELDKFPWNGCKFAAAAVAYLVALKSKIEHKRRGRQRD